MPRRGASPISIKHYFVDEAGDGTLFDRRGNIIAGAPGCSGHFILGLLDVADPVRLSAELEGLRASLLADPFFRQVPSMQPDQRKTAIAFHAKDDCAEVRREVFRLLVLHDVRFHAVIRAKACLVREVRRHNDVSASFRYTSNWLYDTTVKRLFKDRLHKDDQYRVCFATRYNRARTAALKQSLEGARSAFRRKWGTEADSPIEVSELACRQSPCLQAADYFLWALQRTCEVSEDRYLEYIWEKVALTHDVDDCRSKPYGEYYTLQRPLTAEAIKKARDIGPAEAGHTA